MAAAPPPPTSAALQQKDHQVILIQEWGIGEVALKKKKKSVNEQVPRLSSQMQWCFSESDPKCQRSCKGKSCPEETGFVLTQKWGAVWVQVCLGEAGGVQSQRGFTFWKCPGMLFQCKRENGVYLRHCFVPENLSFF